MSDSCTNEFIARERAPDMNVGDAMVRNPKALPVTATVAELRTMFENPHVQTALLVDVDSRRFAGVVHRDALPSELPGDRSVGQFANYDVLQTDASTALTAALTQLDAHGARRMVVIDDDGQTLAGLLCLNKDRSGFCRS